MGQYTDKPPSFLLPFSQTACSAIGVLLLLVYFAALGPPLKLPLRGAGFEAPQNAALGPPLKLPLRGAGFEAPQNAALDPPLKLPLRGAGSLPRFAAHPAASTSPASFLSDEASEQTPSQQQQQQQTPSQPQQQQQTPSQQQEQRRVHAAASVSAAVPPGATEVDTQWLETSVQITVQPDHQDAAGLTDADVYIERTQTSAGPADAPAGLTDAEIYIERTQTSVGPADTEETFSMSITDTPANITTDAAAGEVEDRQDIISHNRRGANKEGERTRMKRDWTAERAGWGTQEQLLAEEGELVRKQRKGANAHELDRQRREQRRRKREQRRQRQEQAAEQKRRGEAPSDKRKHPSSKSVTAPSSSSSSSSGGNSSSSGGGNSSNSSSGGNSSSSSSSSNNNSNSSSGGNSNSNSSSSSTVRAQDSSDTIPAASVGVACNGRKLYVYSLPARFNQWMVDDCVESRLKGFCLTSRHGGLGTRLRPWQDEGRSSNESYSRRENGEGWRNQWFLTENNNNEQIFHSRLLQHPCRTSDPGSADFLFIPAYLGWSIWSLVEHGLFEDRDQPGIELERFLLEENPDFKRLVDQGNHVLVLGRPIWDFRRMEEWGSDFWWRPTFNNVTLLTVEAPREWYGREVFSIPYPTSFHPVGSAEVQGWMNHVQGHARPFLYAFVGGKRSKETIEGVLRGALLRECEGDPKRCLILECTSADAEAVMEAAAEIGRQELSRKAEGTTEAAAAAAATAATGGAAEGVGVEQGVRVTEMEGEEEPQVELRGCMDPRRVAGAMLQAEFCLQPVGDSQTRRSFFDSIISGCIPVVFSWDTFDSQYPWFFDPKPEARRKIAVKVDPGEVISGEVKIGELLGTITEETKEEMRKELLVHIPRLLIRDHTMEGEVGEEGVFEDMVDRTISGLVERKNMRMAGTAGNYFPWFEVNE